MDATTCNWHRFPPAPDRPAARVWSLAGNREPPSPSCSTGRTTTASRSATGHSGQKEIVKPSVDAIQEFKVVTNSYSAEYGRSSSGVVSVSLKSGTNSLNGSLYEFFRDDALNATNYFATTKPVDTRHQFGGAVGFPIVRSKTFFFGDSETGRIQRETTTLSTLPSATARGGQFSRTIIDPLTRLPFPVIKSRPRASMLWRRASSATCRCPDERGDEQLHLQQFHPIRTSRPGTFASTTCSARATADP